MLRPGESSAQLKQEDGAVSSRKGIRAISADLPGRLSASGQYRQVKEEMALQRPRGENRCLRRELELQYLFMS